MSNIKINFHEIRELIPHREPFLFLDELVDIPRRQDWYEARYN